MNDPTVRTAWMGALKPKDEVMIQEELITAVELLRKVALMMRACDPEYCAAHNWGPTDDQHWDEVLNEVEDYVEDHAALGYTSAKGTQQ